MKITRIEGFRCKLGEGPVWDEAEQALYGVDTLARKIWRWDPASAAYREWCFHAQVGSMALRRGGGALLALASGLHLFDFNTGRLDLITDVCTHDARLQLNDGKTDPLGRFLVGSIHTSAQQAEAALYSVAADLSVQTLDQGFIITNGPCFSPDGRTFYLADSVRQEIYAYDYTLATGAVSARRVFANTAALGGIPDGATVDADGGLWVALCGAGKVARWHPDGQLAQVIEMPGLLVSSVAFGGADLNRLFVTSIDGAAAAAEIDMAAGNAAPSDENSGALFVIDGLAQRGLPQPRFAG